MHALTTDRMTMTKPGGPSMRACTPAPYRTWSVNTTIHALAAAFGGARRTQELPT